jgi:hypothetical protein
MDFSASAATKDAARLRRRRFCTPPRFFSTLPYRSGEEGYRGLYRGEHSVMSGSDKVSRFSLERCRYCCGRCRGWAVRVPCGWRLTESKKQSGQFT